MVKILRKNTHVEVIGINKLHDDFPRLMKNLHNRFSIYDATRYKYEPMLMDFYDNEDSSLLNIHLYGKVSDFELKNLFNTNPKANFDYDKFDMIDISMRNLPRNDDQKHLIDFLVGNLNFRYTKPHPQLLVGADTAFGKTYCTINAIATYGAKFLVVVPTTTLVKNWIEELEKHTTLEADKDLLVLTPSVYKALKAGDMDISQYKGFLTTHASLNDIGNTYGWLEITWFFKRLRIGTKVFDEIHKNFHNLIMVDLYTDTYKTIYLSATIKRSDSQESKMLDKFFRGVLYFGKENISNRESNHITGIIFKVKTEPTIQQVRKFKYRRGKMQGITPTLYSKYLVEERMHVVEEVTHKAIDIYDKRIYREGKMLILLTNIIGQEHLYKYIKSNFPDISVKVINSNTKKKDREFDTDIILSSASIMGTGITIYDLVQVLMLDTYSSSITAEQIPNRLRRIPGVTQIYMEMVDMSVPECEKQFKTRYKTLSNMLKKIIYVDMTNS